MNIASYSDLASLLRNSSIWGDVDRNETSGYDFGGVVGLLEACLENLRVNALEAELEELPERLQPQAAAFMIALASRLQAS